MPHNLKRITGQGDLHFITFSCYHRRRLLATAHARNTALQILREVRARYQFALIGYVFMPDHVHLLLSEPSEAPPAAVIQVFKQRTSRHINATNDQPPAQPIPRRDQYCDHDLRFWQRRYFDFNVYSHAKLIEKLHYIHANPVQEKLVAQPADWPWSSWRHYYGRDPLLAMDAWDAPSQSAPPTMNAWRSGKGQPTQRIAQRNREPPEEEGPTLCKRRQG